VNLLQLTVAIWLLTAPADGMNIKDPTSLHGSVAQTLKILALEWELLDPRETDYLKMPQDFASDLKLLQGRFQELRGAPGAGEVARFPSRDQANDFLTYNRNFRDAINDRLDLDMIHADELRVILAETEQLFRVYDAVREARCDYYYVTYRRQALARLRDLVGPEAFYSGQLPPHVPLWRIPETD
jgi:hypothetical protein